MSNWKITNLRKVPISVMVDNGRLVLNPFTSTLIENATEAFIYRYFGDKENYIITEVVEDVKQEEVKTEPKETEPVETKKPKTKRFFRKGLLWWTDGVNEMLATECPEGYRRGRKPSTRSKRKPK